MTITGFNSQSHVMLHTQNDICPHERGETAACVTATKTEVRILDNKRFSPVRIPKGRIIHREVAAYPTSVALKGGNCEGLPLRHRWAVAGSRTPTSPVVSGILPSPPWWGSSTWPAPARGYASSAFRSPRLQSASEPPHSVSPLRDQCCN